MKKTVILGGGAAGMAAAVTAAESGRDVLLLERQSGLGRKLLATGNGRCNLMNLRAPVYYGDTVFAQKVIEACNAECQQRFWHRHGLCLTADGEGRVYPATGQAATVLEILKTAMAQAGVKVRLQVSCTAVQRSGDSFRLTLDNGESLACERLIVACGGLAAPKLGACDSGYRLLKQMGHRILPLSPALTQINTEAKSISGLAGIRTRCGLRLTDGENRLLHEENGELLFTEYGVTGICVMQCARFVVPGAILHVNLLPGLGDIGEGDLPAQLRERRKLFADQPVPGLLQGMLQPKMAYAVCKQAGTEMKNRLAGSLNESELKRIRQVLGDYCLPVTGIRDFENAQVTAGGADCSQFSPADLSSELVSGLHAAGEVLNVDGDCGGFNLMFAFATGILAGKGGA